MAWSWGAPGASKYKAVPTVVDGVKFPSKAQGRRYSDLKFREMAGEIECLVLEPQFELVPAVEIDGKRVRAMRYVADFGYVVCATGEVVVEDVKGVRTPVYRLKRHLMRHVHDIEILETS